MIDKNTKRGVKLTQIYYFNLNKNMSEKKFNIENDGTENNNIELKFVKFTMNKPSTIKEVTDEAKKRGLRFLTEEEMEIIKEKVEKGEIKLEDTENIFVKESKQE